MADVEGQNPVNNETPLSEQRHECKTEESAGKASTVTVAPNSQSENTEMAGEKEDTETAREEGNTEKPTAADNVENVATENQDTDSDAVDHEFVKPEKEIKSPMDLPKWEKSQAYQDYMGFVLSLNESVKGKKLTDECEVSETCQKLINMLDIIDGWIDEIPPIDQPQRFGNKAFRDLFKRLQENAQSLIQPLLPSKYQAAVTELEVYLLDGFGNSTRIDYGTGHEMNYAVFLCCLYKLRILTKDDNVAIAHRVFTRYIDVMRKLQTVYRMEPAGSQGVWGLDDFQFLPFIWGSSQLIGNQRILPKSLPNPEYAEGFDKQYMIFGCIKYIMSVKTGSFGEHSNTLWGISGVAHWTKVNSGLIKMYKAECLMKFPIVQHFPFGTIMSIQLAT